MDRTWFKQLFDLGPAKNHEGADCEQAAVGYKNTLDARNDKDKRVVLALFDAFPCVKCQSAQGPAGQYDHTNDARKYSKDDSWKLSVGLRCCCRLRTGLCGVFVAGGFGRKKGLWHQGGC